jgi:peptide methionine sulfoxide reductase msrA/msrB
MNRLKSLAIAIFALSALPVLGVDIAKLDQQVKEGKLAAATFAGGCFWCMEPPFDKTKGVVRSISGYSGGSVKNPTYRQVSAGGSGHAEVVRIYFDPKKVKYTKLLEVFWRQINPTDGGGQFVDRGSQYRSAIFFHDEAQKKAALASKKKLEASGRFTQPIVTEISKLKNFYEAEEYHQGYYKKNPLRYQYYRNGSGRDRYLDKTWGKDRNVKS